MKRGGKQPVPTGGSQTQRDWVASQIGLLERNGLAMSLPDQRGQAGVAPIPPTQRTRVSNSAALENSGRAGVIHEEAAAAANNNFAASNASVMAAINGTRPDIDNDINVNVLPDPAAILERLSKIRGYMRQVLDMIDRLKGHDNEGNKEMLDKMVKAYDGFKEQEMQYLGIMDKVLAIRKVCEAAGVTDDGGMLLEDIDERGQLRNGNAMEEPSDLVLDNRRPPASSANSISSGLSAFSSDITTKDLPVAQLNGGAIPKKRTAPTPPVPVKNAARPELNENVAGAVETDELKLFQIEKEQLEHEARKQRRQMEALKEQRDMLQHMLRQQEQLRALQGRQTAIDGQKKQLVDQNASVVELPSLESLPSPPIVPPVVPVGIPNLTPTQEAALAAKEQELNDLKNTLASLKQLYAQTKSTIASSDSQLPPIELLRSHLSSGGAAVDAADGPTTGSRQVLEGRMLDLSTKKQRMDQLLSELNQLQAKNPRISASSGTSATMPHATKANINGHYVEKRQPNGSANEPVDSEEELDAETLAARQHAMNELANAREKLARLQSVVARIEAHGAAVPQELTMEMARLVASEVDVNAGESELDFPPEPEYDDEEDIDASEDGLAAMSLRARTEYQQKLAEQQDAVERLREERHRLLAIQSELQKLHNSCSLNENPESEQNVAYAAAQRHTVGHEQTNGVLNSNEEVWQELRHRAIEREAHPQQRPQRRIVAEPLNNTRDNISEASTNQRRRLNADMSCAATWGGSQVPESEDEPEEENEDGAQSPELPEEDEIEETHDNSRGIINNPRLPGFRRNNELDQPHSRSSSKAVGHSASHNRTPLSPATAHASHPGHYQTSVGSGREESLTTSLLDQERLMDDSQPQSNSNSGATPSHRSALLSGPDAEHLHLQQHYHQLQAHIDSIRTIFQDLIQQSNNAPGQPGVVSPATSATNSIPVAPQQQQLPAAMYPPPQQFGMQPWDSWNAATMAVQQHQLMVSLLGCQQQLQMQQAEMRQLQMVCQDLLNTGSVNSEPRTPNQVTQPMTAHAPLDGRPLSSGSLYNLLAPNPYLTFPYYPPPQQQGYQPPMGQSQQQPTSVRNPPSAGNRSPQVMSQSWHQGVQNYPGHLNNSHKTNMEATSNAHDPVMSVRGRRRMYDSGSGGQQQTVPIGKSASHSQVNIFTDNKSPHGRSDNASAASGKLPLNVIMKSSNDASGNQLRGRSESDASTSVKQLTSSNTDAEDSPRPNNSSIYTGARRIINPTGGAIHRGAGVPKLELDDSQKWNAKPKNLNQMGGADGNRPSSVDRALQSTSKGAASSQTSVSSSNRRPNNDPNGSGDQFENLREVIYSEVATLISQNETRPQFLLELFRELQLLSSDYLRARALQAMREVLNKYLTEETETEDEQLDEVGGNFEYPYQSGMDSRPLNGVQSGAADMTMSESVVTSDEEKFKASRSFSSYKPPLSSRDKPHDYAETAASASSLSTPEPTDNLSETVITLVNVENNPASKQSDRLEEKTTNLDSSSRKNSANNFASLKSSRQESLDRTTAALADPDRKVDVTDLEVQIQAIVDELIPFLKDNVAETCTPTLLAYLRKLVLTLATNKCPGADSMGGFLHRQLKTILDDTLIKFSGQKLQDCGEELLADVSEVVFNELAFFRLMQNIDSVGVKSKTSERIRKISGIPRSSEDTVDGDGENQLEQSDPDSIESGGNGTSPESSREASSGPSDSREGSREPVVINDRSEASDEISAQTTVSVSKEAQRVMAMNSASKSVIRRMTSGDSDVEFETVEGPIYSSDEGKEIVKDSDRSHSHSHRDPEVMFTSPLTVQVIAPTDDDDEISTSVSQSMHTAANQSYKGEGSVSGTDSRETTPPDDLLEEQEIPEQIEADLHTTDAGTKPDDSSIVPPDSARSVIIHDFESDEPEAVFTINLNFEPHPENEAALSMNLSSSRRAWEEPAKESDVSDSNDVPESQRGLSGDEKIVENTAADETPSVVTVTLPKLIATATVETDESPVGTVEAEEPEDEEDITTFTFALPGADVSCAMNLDISKGAESG